MPEMDENDRRSIIDAGRGHLIGEPEPISVSVERARKAQQRHEQKHDVQLEISSRDYNPED